MEIDVMEGADELEVVRRGLADDDGNTGRPSADMKGRRRGHTEEC